MGRGSCTAARIMPPPSRCACISAPKRVRRPASSGASGSSSSHRGRGAASRRASDSRRRWPAESLRTSRSSSGASSSCSLMAASGVAAAEPGAPEAQFLRRRCGRSSGHRGGRAGAGPRPAPPPLPARRRTPKNRTAPPAGRSRPATARSRLVLPAPLAPVSATASPARSVRSKPANSGRSPRARARASMDRVVIKAAEPSGFPPPPPACPTLDVPAPLRPARAALRSFC